MARGKGHPLPGSGEARHNEIPETLEWEKGRGDDPAAIVQPDHAVDPDGEPYRYDDRAETMREEPGRGSLPAEGRSRGARGDEQADGAGPESGGPSDDEIGRDQQAHQDRGQSDVPVEREQG
ncbi:MAG TPA: hypothetical protein VGF77_14535 [Allosphingosinicella sp.]|jgi:hypothetical protein